MQIEFDFIYVNQCPLCRRTRWSTSEITSLEVHQGSSRQGNFAKGLGIGALVGVAVIGRFSVSQPCNTDVCGLRALAFPFGGLIGALVGEVVGMAIPD
jgi:hypothetical protein